MRAEKAAVGTTRRATPVEIINAALQECLDADLPNYWPDLSAWAQEALNALAEAGYDVIAKRVE